MNQHKIPPQLLSNIGIDSLNEMQIAANTLIQNENDVLLLAPTGSGKTIGFLLPVFSMLDSSEKGIQCLIIAPSRELALQIEQVWKKMGTGFKVNICYGGHAMKVEIQNLTEPPALLIGTPGRIADHINRGTIDLTNSKIVILDEFDKSLSMGFEDEMLFITEKLTGLEKRILVSATSEITIPEFVGMIDPKVIDFTKKEEKTNDGLILKTVISESKNKTNTLFQLLCYIGRESTLIFCNLRESAELLSTFLQEKGIESAFFHGKMEQLDREKTLVNFRNGSITFLVASDLAARGLDIPLVKNVIHYEMPFNNENFIHRNGRTARMNSTGTAYIILNQNENLPLYLDELPPEFKIPNNYPLPKESEWVTLYISGGKKDKISKMDIVGFLSKKGNLEKYDIGLIEVMDYMAFVAVKKNKVKTVLRLIQNEKMKGKKYKIQIAI
ncbi:MAG: DEAD/DEAH box helicase [Ignavibacteriae bacterium]|nr:DEAD/DEAH box helicase [Ignavibacteriota bacterium]